MHRLKQLILLTNFINNLYHVICILYIIMFKTISVICHTFEKMNFIIIFICNIIIQFQKYIIKLIPMNIYHFFIISRQQLAFIEKRLTFGVQKYPLSSGIPVRHQKGRTAKIEFTLFVHRVTSMQKKTTHTMYEEGPPLLHIYVIIIDVFFTTHPVTLNNKTLPFNPLKFTQYSIFLIN